MELMIRAMDVMEGGDDWVMGDDLVLEADVNDTVASVVERIVETKGIPKERMHVVVPPSKVIDPKDYGLSLRRMGLSEDKDVLVVRPTTKGVWRWHSTAHYEKVFLEELQKHLEGKTLALEDLIAVARKPPVIRTSTRVFLRKYPDVFALETSLETQLSRVKLNGSRHCDDDLTPPTMQLPMFY